MVSTKLKTITVKKFRALNDLKIELGDAITLICGKNGTSKSSVLGIAAQIFSFEKDYTNNQEFDFSQIGGGDFKSQYSEHFRISDVFDQPGSMAVDISLFDGYTNKEATANLELMKRGKSPRPVVRKNSTAEKGTNDSRNFTHPVVFLSLKRLYPIAERKYDKCDFEYLNTHRQVFLGLTNELLNRNSAQLTATKGTIQSAVAHGDCYDQDSVSAGEDNVGQIVMALMSFKKLKEEYVNYKGGLLLIDEADAALFPTAQINLFKMLERECKELNLQVIMTSHSPTLIEYAHEQSQKFKRKYKTIYLSNTFGVVCVKSDWSWAQIYADINTTTIATSTDALLPKVNVYFEDREGADFFSALLYRQSIKKFMHSLPEITLGCTNYLQLIQQRIPEFAKNSIVCLDADVSEKIEGRNYNSVVLLPGHLPPDQLIFEFLYNLPPDDAFWDNQIMFTREVFTNIASEVIRELSISGESVDLKACLVSYSGSKKPREIFKAFYKTPIFQGVLASRKSGCNPWYYWIAKNSENSNKFLNDLNKSLKRAMKEGFSVDVSKLSLLSVRNLGAS